ncbi:DMT family transporter [Rhodovibrionaceae bacterium A322]
MPVFALSAALGAAFCWAAGAMIAHSPAQTLGALTFTRIQLLTSSLLLGGLVTLAGLWSTVAWDHWPGLALSALVAVLLGNLFMIACLRRGGPRRMELLFALNAPMAAILGQVYLGEVMSARALLGAALMLGGVVLAILYGHRKEGSNRFEAVIGGFHWVLLFGVLAAACQAIGLIAIKPAMTAGTDPLAASFLRTGGAAVLLHLLLLWPSPHLRAPVKVTGPLLFWTALPGFLGYVCAVTLLLYALNNYTIGVVAVLGSTAPVITLPLVWWRTGQRPPWPAWIGALVTIAGTGIILQG